MFPRPRHASGVHCLVNVAGGQPRAHRGDAYARPPMATAEPSLPDAMALQALACERLGSPLYAALMRDMKDDYEREGCTYELLHDRPEAPMRDALVLRLLGAVHRIVLRG